MTALLFLLSLSACGFQPLHGAARSAESFMPDIDISNIPDRDGQALRNLLIDRMYAGGRPAAAVYELAFSPLEKNTTNIGIQKDATATLAQLQISTEMRLVEKSTAAVLLRRNLRAAGSYNLLDNQLATLVSRQNVTENLLKTLSDDAVTELNLHFRRSAAGAAP